MHGLPVGSLGEGEESSSATPHPRSHAFCWGHSPPGSAHIEGWKLHGLLFPLAAKSEGCQCVQRLGAQRCFPAAQPSSPWPRGCAPPGSHQQRGQWGWGAGSRSRHWPPSLGPHWAHRGLESCAHLRHFHSEHCHSLLKAGLGSPSADPSRRGKAPPTGGGPAHGEEVAVLSPPEPLGGWTFLPGAKECINLQPRSRHLVV